MESFAVTCRCGYDGPEEGHPCHGQAYTCRKEAKPRLIATQGALAGAQPKVSAYRTYACDKCWQEFKDMQ